MTVRDVCRSSLDRELVLSAYAMAGCMDGIGVGKGRHADMGITRGGCPVLRWIRKISLGRKQMGRVRQVLLAKIDKDSEYSPGQLTVDDWRRQAYKGSAL